MGAARRRGFQKGRRDARRHRVGLRDDRGGVIRDETPVDGMRAPVLERCEDLAGEAEGEEFFNEAAVVDRALTLLVEQLEKVKYGRTDRPRPTRPSDPSSRYIPKPLRRAVSARDGDRCCFVGPEGQCTETAGLQFHHRIPFAEGGQTTFDNVELRCPAHNLYEAERWFGPLFVRETDNACACPPQCARRTLDLPHRSAPREGGPAWSGPSYARQ